MEATNSDVISQGESGIFLARGLQSIICKQQEMIFKMLFCSKRSRLAHAEAVAVRCGWSKTGSSHNPKKASTLMWNRQAARAYFQLRCHRQLPNLRTVHLSTWGEASCKSDWPLTSTKSAPKPNVFIWEQARPTVPPHLGGGHCWRRRGSTTERGTSHLHASGPTPAMHGLEGAQTGILQGPHQSGQTALHPCAVSL